MKRIFLIYFSIILAGVAFAAMDSNKVQELGARYNYISCRVNLVQSQGALLASYGTISTDKITSDLAQLKALADSGDATNFNTELETLKDDFKTVNAELKVARQSFSKSNTSRTDKDLLKSQWNVSLDTYKSCNIDTQRGIVSIRIELLQKDIDNWNAVISNMTARGLDTSELTRVVSDAQKLLSELSDASQIMDDTAFKTRLNDANDEQLHIWARFAIGRIKANIARIEPIIGQTNRSTDLDHIKPLLNSASALAAPGNRYGNGEFKQVWQDIKDASQQLNTLSKDLRDSARANRQTGRNNTNPRNLAGRIPRINLTNKRPPTATNQPPELPGNTQGEQ